MTAVVLACASAVSFAAMTVALRIALRTSPDPVLGSCMTSGVGFVATAAAALVSAADAPLDELWRFSLAGLLAPGLSQILVVAAVAAAGAARVSVVVGSAPLVAVTIAIVFLDEPVEAGLVVGALLIVLGGVALVSERVRPADFRAFGAVLAFGATVLFSTRDNVVRWLAPDASISPLAAASSTFAVGTACAIVFLLVARGRPSRADVRRALVAFAPAGLLFAVSYATLFEALERGRVSVVNPLVATESLWGVLIAILVLGRTELVGRRLVAGAVLVVAGGALIGATR